MEPDSSIYEFACMPVNNDYFYSMNMRLYSFALAIAFLSLFSCSNNNSGQSNQEEIIPFYPSSKPCTRWWWFATEIKEVDVRHQLDWAKKNNFGGVEIAWVYPLHRYQRMYQRNYNRFYPADTSAQKWLSPEWSEIVTYTKRYADSIGLACDFTFGSAWPVASEHITWDQRTQVYGDSNFKQTLTFAWGWPDTLLVIDHMNPEAFEAFASPIGQALKDALAVSKSALFTDSWEIKLNSKYKIWTPGFEKKFEKKFGYDIIPYMDQGLDSFPDVRYDYMLLVDELVTKGFYEPYVEKCKELGAWSRVQCLASPTDVMNTYALVDIPETEAMLNNPNYSRIVSSSAALAGKKMVSSETFTCMYGFPSTYLRDEQTADLKMVADAMFSQGVNFHFYHGMPYNPIGSDTLEFFATTYFGPGGNLEAELPAFNDYMGKVSGWMQKGKTYSDVAVYIPYEDGVMKGAYPPERQRVWVWGEYEMRYIDPAEELEGYHPLWINRKFLDEAKYAKGKLTVGDASFSSLYIDVNYMDIRALERVLELAKKGLAVCLKHDPVQPGKLKSDRYAKMLKELCTLENVSDDFTKVVQNRPLVSSKEIPQYWCRVDKAGNHYIFLAQKASKGLVYPVYSGQSKQDNYKQEFTFNVNGKTLVKTLEFKPYQSLLLKIDKKGQIEQIDISFVPKEPVIKPREAQRMHF